MTLATPVVIQNADWVTETTVKQLINLLSTKFGNNSEIVKALKEQAKITESITDFLIKMQKAVKDNMAQEQNSTDSKKENAKAIRESTNIIEDQSDTIEDSTDKMKHLNKVVQENSIQNIVAKKAVGLLSSSVDIARGMFKTLSISGLAATGTLSLVLHRSAEFFSLGLDLERSGLSEMLRSQTAASTSLMGLSHITKTAGLTMGTAMNILQDYAASIDRYGGNKFGTTVSSMSDQLVQFGVTTDEVGAYLAKYLEQQKLYAGLQDMDRFKTQRFASQNLKNLILFSRALKMSREELLKEQESVFEDLNFQELVTQIKATNPELAAKIEQDLRSATSIFGPEIGKSLAEMTLMVSKGLSPAAASSFQELISSGAAPLANQLGALAEDISDGKLSKGFDVYAATLQSTVDELNRSGLLTQFRVFGGASDYASRSVLELGSRLAGVDDFSHLSEESLRSAEDATQATAMFRKSIQDITGSLQSMFGEFVALPSVGQAIKDLNAKAIAPLVQTIKNHYPVIQKYLKQFVDFLVENINRFNTFLGKFFSDLGDSTGTKVFDTLFKKIETMLKVPDINVPDTLLGRLANIADELLMKVIAAIPWVSIGHGLAVGFMKILKGIGEALIGGLINHPVLMVFLGLFTPLRYAISPVVFLFSSLYKAGGKLFDVFSRIGLLGKAANVASATTSAVGGVAAASTATKAAGSLASASSAATKATSIVASATSTAATLSGGITRTTSLLGTVFAGFKGILGVVSKFALPLQLVISTVEGAIGALDSVKKSLDRGDGILKTIFHGVTGFLWGAVDGFVSSITDLASWITGVDFTGMWDGITNKIGSLFTNETKRDLRTQLAQQARELDLAGKELRDYVSRGVSNYNDNVKVATRFSRSEMRKIASDLGYAGEGVRDFVINAGNDYLLKFQQMGGEFGLRGKDLEKYVDDSFGELNDLLKQYRSAGQRVGLRGEDLAKFIQEKISHDFKTHTDALIELKDNTITIAQKHLESMVKSKSLPIGVQMADVITELEKNIASTLAKLNLEQLASFDIEEYIENNLHKTVDSIDPPNTNKLENYFKRYGRNLGLRGAVLDKFILDNTMQVVENFQKSASDLDMTYEQMVDYVGVKIKDFINNNKKPIVAPQAQNQLNRYVDDYMKSIETASMTLSWKLSDFFGKKIPNFFDSIKIPSFSEMMESTDKFIKNTHDALLSGANFLSSLQTKTVPELISEFQTLKNTGYENLTMVQKVQYQTLDDKLRDFESQLKGKSGNDEILMLLRSSLDSIGTSIISNQRSADVEMNNRIVMNDDTLSSSMQNNGAVVNDGIILPPSQDRATENRFDFSQLPRPPIRRPLDSVVIPEDPIPSAIGKVVEKTQERETQLSELINKAMKDSSTSEDLLRALVHLAKREETILEDMVSTLKGAGQRVW